MRECVLFENVSRDARPHPEERACERRSANSKARARVSKDEDVHAGLMLRDASQRIWAVEGPALAPRCDAPAMLLSMRARVRGSFWRAKPRIRSSPRKRGPIVTAGGYGSRLSLRSAGTTNRLSKAPTCGCTEAPPGAISLFPDCYLQWLLQLQRVGPARAHVSTSVVTRNSRPHVSPDVSPSVVIICFAFEASMPARRIRIAPSHPPPGPRPR
jgi:hypothetical protein